MTKKQQAPKVKHVPQRTCIACRKVEGKRALIRLVRIAETDLSPSKVEVDLTGKKAGRGAYLCAKRSCWQNALKGNRLEQALRTKLTAQNRQELLEYAMQLPEEDDNSE